MLLRGLLLLFTTITMAAPITYELVSIHKSKPKVNTSDLGGDTPEGTRMRSRNLCYLLSQAYGFSFEPLLKEQIIGLPGWAELQLFDIDAKVDDSDVQQLAAVRKNEDTMAFAMKAFIERNPTTRMRLLQQLLEERFHLKMHYEQRVMPVYALTIARGGVKMKPSDAKNPEQGVASLTPGDLRASNTPIDFLVLDLNPAVGRPVVNQTNLAGRYDVRLKFAPNSSANPANAGENSAPSIFTAVQEELGLKLVPAKEPVWVIVVDHVELPADN